ncbi:hypothetical protein CR513_23511, partial [Mucuna pruriens]
MGKTHIPDPPNFKKYGVPFYSVAWIPQHIIKSHQIEIINDSSNSNHNSAPVTNAEPKPVTIAGYYLVFTDNGGVGRSNIPNALVCKLGTDSELPYRMELNSNGDGLICGMETPKKKRQRKGDCDLKYHLLCCCDAINLCLNDPNSYDCIKGYVPR